MSSLPREVPNNQDAEQGLLGALLVDNRALDRVSDFLRAEHFFVPVHGRIYEAVVAMVAAGRNCDPVTLKKYFEPEADLKDLKGGAYLADLASSCVSIRAVEDYGRELFDLSQRRQIIATADEAIKRARVPEHDVSAAEIISETEAALYEIAEGASEQPQVKEFSGALAEAIASAAAAYRRDPGATGLSTGLIDLDKITGGLRQPDLIVLAGRPGMGKSAMAMGISMHLARHGNQVAFFSLEMSAEQLATRVLAAEAKLSSDLVRRGEISGDQFSSLMSSAHSMASFPLHIDDSAGQTLNHIRTRARRLKRKHGLSLIVVDYLQLINTTGKDRAENRVQEITVITKGLKNIAKELCVPVLALSQLSRQVEQRDDKRPMLSDLRESGSIEQDADSVTFMFREEYYLDKAEPARNADEKQDKYLARHSEWMQRKSSCANKAEAIVAKNRHGATGTAYLHFDGPTTTFSNLSAYYSVAGAA